MERVVRTLLGTERGRCAHFRGRGGALALCPTFGLKHRRDDLALGLRRWHHGQAKAVGLVRHGTPSPRHTQGRRDLHLGGKIPVHTHNNTRSHPSHQANVQRRIQPQREQSTTVGTVYSHVRARAWVAGSLAASDVTARPGGAEAVVTARCDQGVGHGRGTI